MKFRPAARGYTLIELLVSAVIVALLASVAVPMAELTFRRSKERDLREALREVRGAIDAYKTAVDDGRIYSEKFASGYPQNLNVLVEGVIDVRSPNKDRKIYFLRRIPRDPFADPSADPIAAWGKRSYISSPNAPESGEDVFDIFSQSTDTGLDGSRYDKW